MEFIVNANGQLINLGRLSYGEKVILSLAFLLAVVQHGQPRLCLLDDVHARMERETCRRFAELVKKLSRNTQFIVTEKHEDEFSKVADRVSEIKWDNKCGSIIMV